MGGTEVEKVEAVEKVEIKYLGPRRLKPSIVAAGLDDKIVIMDDWLEMRQELVSQKKAAEDALKELDNEIKLFMVQNNYEDYQRADGLRLRIAYGTNKRIDEKAVIGELIKLELNPDQVQEFIQKVTAVTKYDYIDMRKVKTDE